MINDKYMRRALQIARNGLPYAMPNPMVGAVITAPDGRIIGEGYHRKCGEAHAEVNAIASVQDQRLLHESTMYVTLEPCAHYGRTGPCSKLIIEKGIPNVVIGTRDPFSKVDGKGIEMMRDAGIKVTVGMLEYECRSLNAIFFTAHTEHRPFIILKWAQSADGYMDKERGADNKAARISTALTSTLTHQLRAICDSILVGSGTVLADAPALDTRLWPGKSPRPIVLDRRRLTLQHTSLQHHNRGVVSRDDLILWDSDCSLKEMLHQLYELYGMTSLLVEGGPTVLESFIADGLWDVARIETSPESYGDKGTAKAPALTEGRLLKIATYEGQNVKYYSKNPLVDVKNL